MRQSKARLFGAVMLFASIVPAGAANAQSYWQCVPFARMVSGIDLFGAAASWWHQAAGRYDKGSLPQAGAVLVFKAISSMRSGHVATVSKIISDRIIEVTHANWSVIRGRRGQIERNVRVVDVSPANDWSRVRVWWAPTQDLGTTDYPTYGFIYGKAAAQTAVATVAPPAPATFLTSLSLVSLKPITGVITPKPAGQPLVAQQPMRATATMAPPPLVAKAPMTVPVAGRPPVVPVAERSAPAHRPSSSPGAPQLLLATSSVAAVPPPARDLLD